MYAHTFMYSHTYVYINCYTHMYVHVSTYMHVRTQYCTAHRQRCAREYTACSILQHLTLDTQDSPLLA